MSDITMIEHSNGFIDDHSEVILNYIDAWKNTNISIDIKHCMEEIAEDLQKNNKIDGIIKLMLIIKLLLDNNNKNIIDTEELYYVLDLSLGITNAYAVCNSKVIRNFIKNKSYEM